MDRASMLRRLNIICLVGGWAFLLISLASFHPDDWPSHQVYPYPATQNLCGTPGAWIAYQLFFVIGQGVFPILFFSGVCLALYLFHNKVSDLWLRAIGLALLSVAFASAVHLIRPGSPQSFPEGHGGIIGISTSMFLKQHFNAVGSGLILLLAFLIGLLLAADDLVVRTPGALRFAVEAVRERSNDLGMKFPSLPRLNLASLLGTDDTGPGADDPSVSSSRAKPAQKDEEIDPSNPAAVLRQNRMGDGEKVPFEHTVSGQQIELTYDNDEPAPAAIDVAYTGDSDAPPSESAIIPPPEQRVVVPPPAPVAPLAPIKRAQPTTMGAQGPSLPAQAAAGLRKIPGPNVENLVTAIIPAGVLDHANTPTSVAGATSPPADDDEMEAAGQAGSAVQQYDNDGNPIAASADAPLQRAEIIFRGPAPVKPKSPPPPPPRPRELGEYHLPGWDMLAEAEHGYADAQEKYVREKAAMLEQALREFNIDAHVTEIDTGPVITMYEISLAPGIKVAAITALSNDIARALSATSVRIVAPVPGKNTVGIEVPNAVKEKVRFKELLQLAPEALSKMSIPLFLGKDASGEPLVTDLTAMPHCLIAGTTGSGKSVCINTIIMSVLYTQRPDMVKMILIDPKVVEMAPFKDIPHLMAPVINDSARAVSVLEWACEKMDERYELLAEAGVRNIKDYNKLTKEELFERFMPNSPEEEAKIPKFIPYWIIIIDELADLMMTSGKEVEVSIVRLAQKARAVGIHLIVATQRPQATVVTGLIKANLPSKIAFRVNTRMDSRIVLDQNGAELLLGYGDMLFLHPTTPKPIRSQGTYIDDKEIKESVKLVKALAEAQYEPELMQIKAKFNSEDMKQDDMFDDAVKVVLETKRGSVSLLQRRLNIGYGRAAKLIEMMASAGIVGDYKGTQSREATINLEQWEQMKAQEQRDIDDGMTV